MSRSPHPSRGAGSTYSPSTRSDRCTPADPWGAPARPTGLPRETARPAATSTDWRYETETCTPGEGWIVTDRIPATEPAKVTVPETGATTTVPDGAARSTPQCPA
ncbi:MAG: hypothetical protein DIU67_001675 [Actinomycetes bacterium]|jgi:hypothetical protein